jgi:hypothetical protein
VINLAVAIMAHHSRVDRLPALIDRLKPAAPHVEIDYENKGPWLTAKRCWEAAPSSASHLLILQDDVRVCLDFYSTVCRLIRYRPGSAIGLYANHKVIDAAKAAGKSWAKVPRSCGEGRGGVWGQAQLIPTAWIPRFLSWWAALPAADITPEPGVRKPFLWHDDLLLGLFIGRVMRQDVWCTAPSLVEHDCPTESTIGYSNRNKVARWYIGDAVSGLSVNWKPCD